MSLSKLLLSSKTSTPYSDATQSDFIIEAGKGTLEPRLLALWLYQDRIYAGQAYPQLIGTLISKIPFSTYDALNSPEESRNQNLLKLLTKSLDMVVRETSFFVDMSEKWGLNISCWKLRRATKEYIAEMARIANQCTLEEALVFVWAMEKIYYDAWSFAKSIFVKEGRNPGSAVAAFVSNWTTDEFSDFVNEYTQIVDGLGISEDSPLYPKVLGIWNRAVELESDFWPTIGEEKSEDSTVTISISQIDERYT